MGFFYLFVFFLFCSEAKTCLAKKRVAFVGDSRIRQLFYSFVKVIEPERREDGNKVSGKGSEMLSGRYQSWWSAPLPLVPCELSTDQKYLVNISVVLSSIRFQSQRQKLCFSGKSVFVVVVVVVVAFKWTLPQLLVTRLTGEGGS